jgi:hypothetical protein
MLFVFQTFFTEKNGEIFKAFSPLFNFLLSFSPETRRVVKMFWVFHLISSRKLMENERDFSPRIQQKNLKFPTSVIGWNVTCLECICRWSFVDPTTFLLTVLLCWMSTVPACMEATPDEVLCRK